MTVTVLQLKYHVKSPVFPNARKISGLLEAVAILDSRVIKHDHTARNDGGVEDDYLLLTVFLLFTL